MKVAATKARNHSGTTQHGACTRRRGMTLAFAITAHSEQEHIMMTLLKSADQQQTNTVALVTAFILKHHMIILIPQQLRPPIHSKVQPAPHG